MQRVRSCELSQHVGSQVRLQGWLSAHRKLGGISFLVLRDGWGTVQVTADAASLEPLARARAGLESVIDVRGEVRENPKAPGGLEVIAPTIDVLVAVGEPLPVALGKALAKAKLPDVLEHAPTVLRDPSRRAVFELSAGAMAGFRRRLGELGFTEVQTPKIIRSASEGGANVFTLDYFGRPAFLAQSPQFYKQTMVGVFERVYEVGPVFRAEPHDTGRHLAEYVSLDAELGFVRDHFDVMAIVREAVEGMVDAMVEHTSQALELLDVTLPEVATEIPWLHFSETEVDDVDLAPADERRLGEWALDEHGSDFVFVTGFPMAKRPFYTHPEPERPEYSNSFDLLFRGLEIVTGGQRLHRYGDYLAALEARGERPEPYDGYLQAFRYGMPPHGGFALGLERFTARIVGAQNVRETTLFPRDRTRLTP